jgi:hypothetical protein
MVVVKRRGRASRGRAEQLHRCRIRRARRAGEIVARKEAGPGAQRQVEQRQVPQRQDEQRQVGKLGRANRGRMSRGRLGRGRASRGRMSRGREACKGCKGCRGCRGCKGCKEEKKKRRKEARGSGMKHAKPEWQARSKQRRRRVRRGRVSKLYCISP